MTATLFCLGLLLFSGIGRQVSDHIAPPGWRYPTESDYVGDWLQFKNTIPVPFHIKGDFNGDGLLDDVWILIRTDGDSYSVFVFLGRKQNGADIVQLETGQGPAQRHGLELVKPGKYLTACGKGAFDCRTGEPESVELRAVGFKLFLYESGSLLYFWDTQNGSFKQLQLSN